MAPATSAKHIACQELRIGGLRIHAQIWGEGEPLLLLHSPIWAEAGVWEPLLPYLAGFRTIAFDPPGIGRSAMPARPISMPALAWLGAAMLDEFGIESAHVLGASSGGAVAQQMALSHPGRVRRLVLASTSSGAFAIPGHPAALLRLLHPGSYRGGLEEIAGDTFGGRLRTEPQLVRAMPLRSPQNTWTALYNMAPLTGWTSLPWLWAIRQPTLVICGDDDPITPPVNHRILAALIPRAQLHTIQGGGHLMLRDSPARAAPFITSFLRGGQPDRGQGGSAGPVQVRPGLCLAPGPGVDIPPGLLGRRAGGCHCGLSWATAGDACQQPAAVRGQDAGRPGGHVRVRPPRPGDRQGHDHPRLPCRADERSHHRLSLVAGGWASAYQYQALGAGTGTPRLNPRVVLPGEPRRSHRLASRIPALRQPSAGPEGPARHPAGPRP